MRAQLDLYLLIPMNHLGMMIRFLRFQIDPGDKHRSRNEIVKLILLCNLAAFLLPTVQGRKHNLNLMSC